MTTTTLPSTFTKKHSRKNMTAAEIIADLDTRFWNIRHEIIETTVRPTGVTFTVRSTHRTDRLHSSVCPWCR